jgi:hypothetical protein
VAAAITKATALDVELVEGSRGEFTVWVDEAEVARKDTDGFPSDATAVAAVRRALARA